MNVALRPLEVGDAQTSVKWRNMPEIWVYTERHPDRIITLEDEQNWIKSVLADQASKRFAIVADRTYVGNIYLTNIVDGVGEYHIFIGDKNFLGKGVAKTASLELFKYASTKLNLRQIKLKVKEENCNAVALYRKLGFKEKGMNDGFVLMTLDLHNHTTKEQL